MYQDSYCVLDSDDDRAAISSSEEELNELLGIPGHPQSTGTQGDEDDFEKQMEAELDQTMTLFKAEGGISSVESGDEPAIKHQPQPQKYYDDIYFDSDDSDEDNYSLQQNPSSSKRKRIRRKRRVLSNDELLYDPEIDDQNQRWMDDRRRRYLSQTRNYGGPSKSNILPESDAVLNCPSCLTTLCMDCQRHDNYHNQYRAMFVFNCVIERAKVLRYRDKKQCRWNKKKKKKTKAETGGEASGEAEREGTGTPTGKEKSQSGIDWINMEIVDGPGGLNQSGNDLYHPVKCAVCRTEVAVFDRQEVYHFHNSVASHT